MAMMPSASTSGAGGSGASTESPFIIDQDDESGPENDMAEDEGAFTVSSRLNSLQPKREDHVLQYFPGIIT